MLKTSCCNHSIIENSVVTERRLIGTPEDSAFRQETVFWGRCAQCKEMSELWEDNDES